MKRSQLRQEVLDKSGGVCWYCGQILPSRGWHIDHIEPIYRDRETRGDDSIENLARPARPAICLNQSIAWKISGKRYRRRWAGHEKQVLISELLNGLG